MTTAWAWACAAAFAMAVVGTGLVLWASRRWGLLDVPNERSAHRAPTPTLGGIGLVAGIAVGAGLLPAVHGPVARGLAAGLAVLSLSALDDLGRPLGVRTKLLLQAAAAACWIGLGPGLELAWAPGGWGMLLQAAWLLWLMNVFNFMDGTDGLTATQGIALGAGGACALSVVGSPLAALPLVTAAAAGGFLLLNAPPARIFMGDIGSLSLGYVVGITALAAQPAGVPLWASLLPLTLYAVDTTWTLLRRAQRGENVLQAHKEHLYQRLAQAGWSHRAVAGAALSVTVLFSQASCWLLRGEWTPGLAAAGTGAVALAAGLLWKERRHGAG